MIVISQPPKSLGHVDMKASEYIFNLYLPIKDRNSRELLIPHNLNWVRPMVYRVIADLAPDVAASRYFYLTVKYLWVTGDSANRPGWHADGFLTDDLNYIWYDKLPTEFAIRNFVVDPDHVKSLDQFEEQAKGAEIVTYPTRHILRLDHTNVHRVAYCHEPGFRTFVKMSVSKHLYDLEGNAKNPRLPLVETYHQRADVRNDPNKAQNDFSGATS